ncbi:MAG: ATP-binding cassette domain-containing protein [Clostridia bacterium]|nr:ATP-binding cassette domain-containing protein [Clostridia bacterium]
MAFIEIKNLSFLYPGAEKAALNGINLTVEEGEFVLIAGASGCGKSTLLRRLKPVISAYGAVEGGVFIGGEPVEALSFRRQSAEIGFVMQDPEMQIATDKVWHELAFGLESLGIDQRTMRVRVAEMASFFGIQELFNMPVNKLSGGQKQLVCLASVMVMQPKLLLLDEPTSQLDPIAAADFFDTLKRINSELGTTIIITEHRVESLFPIVDKFVFMDGGSVRYCGEPRACAPLLGKDERLKKVLPTAMTVFYATNGGQNNNAAPLTVREGREYVKTLVANSKPAESAYDKKAAKPRRKAVKQRGEKPVVSMRDCWYRYDRAGEDILKGVSLDIYAGELVCIVGGNGTGKTTCIMTASGMYKPYRGKVVLDGKPISKYGDGELFGKRVGVLMQNPILSFVKDSVREELIYTAKTHGVDKSRVDEVAAEMEIETILDSNPYDISGGELQRAAIAKLLIFAPPVIFLDEATKGMDVFFKSKFGALLRGLAERGTAIVLVSHDIEFCAEYADRLMMFFDGGVIADGLPEATLLGNNFYTTVAARISNGIVDGAITASALIDSLSGERI